MVKNTVGGKKEVMLVKSIQKRDGTLVPFDLMKIVGAIHKGMLVVGEGSLEEAELVATKVFADLVRISKKFPNFVPTVEGIQDSVEKELILSEYVKTAKEYILYRAKRNELRKEVVISKEIKDTIAESSKYFKGSYQEFIFYQFYARFRDEFYGFHERKFRQETYSG